MDLSTSKMSSEEIKNFTVYEKIATCDNKNKMFIVYQYYKFNIYV